MKLWPCKNPVVLATIREMLPRSNAVEVGARLGISGETVNRIARSLGVPVHRRGQPYIGTPSYWICSHTPKEFKPRGRRALDWVR